MFIQVMQGTTSDAAGIRRQLDRWMTDLKPGAEGWLGTTAGVSADGGFIAIVRFSSQDAARGNSGRPEQGEWWAETEKYFDGQVLFHDCPDVDTVLEGGSDDAGFVQVMQGRVTDIAAARELARRMSDLLPDVRPDVIGSTSAWNPANGRYTETIYFTSEAEAREHEQKMGDAPEAQSYRADWEAITAEEPKFIDLTDPWLWSA